MNLFNQLFGTNNTQAVNAQQAQAALESKESPFLLDVRQPDEYRAGHIAGSTLIPLGELTARIGELPQDREILCVCRSGSRSGSAVRLLSSKGYKAVNLSGGIFAWQHAGLPIKKGSAR